MSDRRSARSSPTSSSDLDRLWGPGCAGNRPGLPIPAVHAPGDPHGRRRARRVAAPIGRGSTRFEQGDCGVDSGCAKRGHDGDDWSAGQGRIARRASGARDRLRARAHRERRRRARGSPPTDRSHAEAARGGPGDCRPVRAHPRQHSAAVRRVRHQAAWHQGRGRRDHGPSPARSGCGRHWRHR